MKTPLLTFVETTAFLVVVVGVVFIAHKNVAGQYLMAVAQILWLIFAYKKRHYGLAMQSLVLLAVAAYAIYLWQ